MQALLLLRQSYCVCSNLSLWRQTKPDAFLYISTVESTSTVWLFDDSQRYTWSEMLEIVIWWGRFHNYILSMRMYTAGWVLLLYRDSRRLVQTVWSKTQKRRRLLRKWLVKPFRRTFQSCKNYETATTRFAHFAHIVGWTQWSIQGITILNTAPCCSLVDIYGVCVFVRNCGPTHTRMRMGGWSISAIKVITHNNTKKNYEPRLWSDKSWCYICQSLINLTLFSIHSYLKN